MSRIYEFNEMVLKKGAKACLPVKLDTKWLDWLVNELAFLKEEGELSENSFPPSCAISAVAEILMHRNRSIELQIQYKELLDTLVEYLFEIELERMRRNTDIRCEPATLDTIFTNRQVRLWKDS